MLVQNMLPVVCASCQKEIEAPIINIVDGQNVPLKAAFMREQLNTIACSACQTEISVTTPILYYDQTKQMAFVFVPPELNLTKRDRKLEIHDLVTAARAGLPENVDSAFLAKPIVHESFDTLLTAIFAGDGVTQEMLDRRHAKAQLINKFMAIVNEGDTLREQVKAHDAELDHDFFEVLTSFVQMVEEQGDEAAAHRLVQLRTLVAKYSSQGKVAVAEVDSKLGRVFVTERDDLLDRLQQARHDDERRQIVGGGFHLLDKAFFDMLARRIKTAAQAKDVPASQALQMLQDDIVRLKTNHGKSSQAALETAEALFKKILQAKHPDKVLERKASQLDETFFFVLGANIAKARRQEQEEIAQALETLGRTAASLVNAQAG